MTQKMTKKIQRLIMIMDTLLKFNNKFIFFNRKNYVCNAFFYY